MAICWMIRKASPSVVPLALRAIGSSWTTLNQTSPCNQSHSLSSIADDKDSVVSNLLATLKQEIKSTKSYIKNFNVASPSHAFPFEIEVDDKYERKLLTLTIKYPDDEEVVITIDMYDVNTKDIDSYYYETHFDDDFKDESNNNESYKEDINAPAIAIPIPIPMHVEVKKAGGLKSVKFHVTISTDEIFVKDYSITNEEKDYGLKSCTGPTLNGRLSKLQPYIYKYLETRGINNNMASFLLKYIAKKKKEIDLKTLILFKKATWK